MEFKTDCELIDYSSALNFMEERVESVIKDTEDELIWFVEHPPIITGGSSADPADLLNDTAIEVHYSGRGGKYTYHGPGQRVVYLILNLKKRAEPNQPDLKEYIYQLEQIIINSLAEINITGKRIKGKVGIWVDGDPYPAKIAAIGIRLRKWVSYHGIAININPNLEHFKYIVPCGIREYGVTSIEELNNNCSKNQFDLILEQQIRKIFSTDKFR